MLIFDDNPAIEDALGFGPTAAAIAETITSAARRPLVIGVFGGWGTGKTSLMQIVDSRLREGAVKTVWFNAWKYSGKEVIWNALIQTLLLAMKDQSASITAADGSAFRKRVVAVSQELAKYAAKAATRLVPGGIITETDIDGMWSALTSSVADGSSFEFINRFEFEFQRLVDEFVGDSMLVVFIDDLDRCLPENAVEVLEALKLYLDNVNCVFVIGVEPSIIETAIKLRYGAGNSSLSAAKYLEKIVQVPIFVPRIRTQSGVELIGMVTGDTLARRPEMARLIQIGMDRNPRRVKRFANSLSVALSSVPSCSTDEQLLLAKVLTVQSRFPEFFRELGRDAGLIRKLEDDASRDAWIDSGLRDLSDDFELRRFLRLTREIPSPRTQVRRWIRVVAADPRLDPDDDA